MFFNNRNKRLKELIDGTRKSVANLRFQEDGVEKGLEGQVDEIITAVLENQLEEARCLIDKVERSDLKIQLFCICAVASNGDEEDLISLRKLIEFHQENDDDPPPGLFLFIYGYSRNSIDLGVLRRRIQRADPFSQVHSYLALYVILGEGQDLAAAKRAADTETAGKPLFRVAGLVMISLFTSKVDDFNKMKEALNCLNEITIRMMVPADINIEKILDSSNDFRGAFEAVDFIDDEYLRAMVWTIIGFFLIRRVLLQLLTTPIIV